MCIVVTATSPPPPPTPHHHHPHTHQSVGEKFLQKASQACTLAVATLTCLEEPLDCWMRAFWGVLLPLINDGDLLAAISKMMEYRGLASVNVSKAKGYADQFVVDDGSVRLEDFIGNDGADTAADFCRLRQKNGVVNARRAPLHGTPSWLNSTVLELRSPGW